MLQKKTQKKKTNKQTSTKTTIPLTCTQNSITNNNIFYLRLLKHLQSTFVLIHHSPYLLHPMLFFFVIHACVFTFLCFVLYQYHTMCDFFTKKSKKTPTTYREKNRKIKCEINYGSLLQFFIQLCFVLSLSCFPY